MHVSLYLNLKSPFYDAYRIRVLLRQLLSVMNVENEKPSYKGLAPKSS